MGSLTLPASGVVYIDTAPLIYSVEKHSEYEQPFVRCGQHPSQAGYKL